MADVVMSGGGICGLLTSMLLAKDGHTVTVLERDGMEPPAPEDAWEAWERRGVNQFRLLHYFLPRFRHVAERELPEVVEAFDRAGALRFNFIDAVPEFVSGGRRDGDDRFEAITGRRPVMESAAAAAAEATEGVTVRRGVAVEALLSSPGAGVPHVTGVRLRGGEELRADLVVDAMGRRSPLPSWLAALGARPPIEELDDCGFVYYGRHFRSPDGTVPPPFGGLLQPFGSISILTLPCDHGTWGVGVVTSAADRAMRGLKDADRWARVVKQHPTVAHWLDGEPLDDDVVVMAKIEDRYRRFVVDGEPVATGVVPVADAWACTNPSIGRGMSIGLLHATVLRDTIASQGLDDPRAFALAYDAATVELVEPHFRETLQADRDRLAEIDALVAGAPYDPPDDASRRARALFAAAGTDPDLLRATLDIASLLRTGAEVLSSPQVAGKVESLLDSPPPPPPAPTRDELLSLVA